MRILDRALVIGVSVLSATAFAAGCGGDDSDDGGDGLTGLASGKKLSELSAPEATQACTRFVAAYQDVLTVSGLCTLLSAIQEDTADACVTARDTCIQQAGTQGTADMQFVSGLRDIECDGQTTLNACTGTVGELETCADDAFTLLRAFFGQVSCEDAPTLDASDAGGLMDMFAPSCETVDCGDGSPFGD